VSSGLRRRRRPDPALAKAAWAGASSSEEAGAGDDAQAGLAANLGLDGAAAAAVAGLLPGLLQRRASEHLRCHRRRCLQAKARHLFLSVAAGGSPTRPDLVRPHPLHILCSMAAPQALHPSAFPFLSVG